MLTKLPLIILTALAVSACTTSSQNNIENNVKDGVERVGECIWKGNVNDNCELTTLEYGHQN